ncbi:discoidin domain-containing protein [Streptomyces sp. MS1.HAVA.3]|uniref:Discoidin domain-containing protein n=1 Tax=Streptomyces caledonius TaxID=3134107 RepID=A0ABU8U8Y2_9ACTN
MQQPILSRIPLFTAADFAWNPRGYRAGESWQAAVRDLAGSDPREREAVAALAGNTASSGLKQEESAYLKPLVEQFWKARAAGDPAAGTELRKAFTVLREAPARLTALSEEAGPWLERLSRYGAAGELAVDVLQAQASGDGAAAWQASRALAEARKTLAEPGPAQVDKAVLDPFLTKAAAEADAWTGVARATGTVTKDAQAWTVRLDSARPLSAVTVMTDPFPAGARAPWWRSTYRARAGARSPTRRRRAGPRSTRRGCARTRCAWPGPGRRPRCTRWCRGSGRPRARFELADGGKADAEIGGAPQRVTAQLSALGPGEVRGQLSAQPPAGIEVRLPQTTVVPRGGQASIPLEVVVAANTPPGSYQIPVTFDGESRTLTVRAVPRTGGPDLLRTARASSSADETAGFPASAAVDGSPSTRWSSPAVDGAWWQAQLPAPVRIGRLELHWQDAYPSAYRVETSADGVTWREAAAVTASRGGHESLRLDAPDTRFLRITCDRRATRYGCSLWSAEAYAVTP